MGRKSTKEDKNIYQLSREACEFTREHASELLGFISADRLFKIEFQSSLPHPEEILAMSKCYRKPSLCNHYCSQECPIGQNYVPKVEIKSLSQITLEMLATLNALTKDKERLIEITVDGEITPEELPDFLQIQQNLEDMSMAIDSLKLWVNDSIANGRVSIN